MMSGQIPHNYMTAHSPTGSTVQRSPWHSPVPYLFGGLAAMLGLIAFALLILACSYWKFSGYLENNENADNERDVELGDADQEKQKNSSIYEEKILVIMAGQAHPTFLATPVTSRASSFGSVCSSSSGKSSQESETENQEKENEKNRNCDQIQTGVEPVTLQGSG